MDTSEERFARQIKKGVMEMLVLQLLAQKPGYGYDLLLRLGQAPGGTLSVKEGTLYPILYRLEEDGLLESGWQTGEGRTAPKKIYTITDKGRERLSMQIRVWQTFGQDVSYMIEQEDENHGI